MAFQPKVILSTTQDRDAQNCLSEIKKSNLEHIEVSGTFFESENFASFYSEVFKAGKNITSVTDIVPANLSRNWASSSESIQNEVRDVLLQKIALAGRYNIKYFSFDLGLDAIRAGTEIKEISLRAKLLESLTPSLKKAGITLCQPIRFPKTFPGSEEWRLATMLVTAVMHENVCTEINVFPAEVNNSRVGSLLKKTFYTTKLIRFRYEPALENKFSADMHTFWAESLKAQGFTGDLVFTPVVESLDAEKQSLDELSLVKNVYLEEAEEL